MWSAALAVACGAVAGAPAGGAAAAVPAEQAPAARAVAEDTRPDPLVRLLEDMTLPHEALPAGVPDAFDWKRGPRIGARVPPPSWSAFIPWGHLYVAEGGHDAPNTRVQIRRIRAYLLRRSDGQWHRVAYSAAVDGGWYAEDYRGDANRPADVRPAPEAQGGGVTATAGGGYNFHFWSVGGRVGIDPLDIAGVYTTVEARLVLADADGPDDRAAARYLLGMGADFWENRTDPWRNWENVWDAGIGRFRFVTTRWQSFHMHTLDADTLRAHPPPLLCAGAAEDGP